jgi:hypothetical protein
MIAFIIIERSTLSNYLLPTRANSRQALSHHTPATARRSAVTRTEMKDHIDGHYCSAGVAFFKEISMMYPEDSVFFSIDDKAKVPIGIPAVSTKYVMP